MRLERYPRSVWTPLGTVAVSVLVALPIVGACVIGGARTAGDIATTTQFVLFPVILLSGLLLSFQYRASDCMEVAWVTACITAYAVPGLVLTGLRAVDSHLSVRTSGWIVAVHLPLAVLMAVVIRRADRTTLRGDPLIIGILVGTVVAACCVVAYRLAPGVIVNDFPNLMIVLEISLLATCVALALAASRLALPRWSADRLALIAMTLGINHLAIAQPLAPAISVIAIATAILGAVCLADVAAALLRDALQEQRAVVLELVDRVAHMEADDRDSQARLHELTNSIAGIAVASSMIHGHKSLTGMQRQSLEEMLDSESHRLARMLGGDRLAEVVQEAEKDRSASRAPVLQIDDVIRPIVTSHLALHRRVHWEPSGEVARGDADAMAEILNILVDNAARHAPDSEITVEVSRQERAVEIAVRDNGPGLPEEVRRRLGEWGARGMGSRGKGIGLFLAHQLVATHGHSLRLDMNATGTTFVVSLPITSEEIR